MVISKGKYKNLTEFLLNSNKEVVHLTFKDIENIIGTQLSPSMYKYHASWANNSSNFSKCWLRAGYLKQNLNLEDKTVDFVKGICKPAGTSANKSCTYNSSVAKLDAAVAKAYIESYFNATVKDPHGRFLSWRHCYNAFVENRNKTDDYTVDYLLLHLAFYLASWGMYRGSSFLLQKDYKIHANVVRIIQEDKYNILSGISAEELCKAETLDLLEELSTRIKDAYAKEMPTGDKEINNATDTLVTKILLGTLGCVPAYDRYYIAGVKRNHISSGRYNAQSVYCIAKYYIENKDVFEPLRIKLSECGTEYPPMKLMDMCFWEDGVKAEANGK